MTKAQEAYKEFMAATTAALAPNQYWCIANDEGIFEATASKDMGECVRGFCEALDIDWDDATEQGCRVIVAKRCANGEQRNKT